MTSTGSQPQSDHFKERVRHYAEILNDLFDHTLFMRQDRLFEFVCTLVRAGGIHGPGWDPWYESQAVLDDLRIFMSWPLPDEEFPDPARTKMRLALLSYCHITEVDLPYVLLANLLRLRLGLKYHTSPFADLAKPLKKKGVVVKLMPPFPRQKIGRIKELAEKSNKPEIGEALGEIYDNIIRNAVYHSDYVLHENSMHLMKDSRFSKEQGCFTPLVTFEELEELINNAFAFYSAFFFLYERCRRLLADFKNMIVPYDLHCKGLLELLFDEEHRLIGFRVYWPNGSCSEYGRSKDASMGVNLQFEKDGSINLFVGRLASNPSKFSPLVEEGDAPNYPVRPDTDIRPHWPQPLAIYRLPLDSGLEDVGT